jgi:type IV fimbrial biogenesis protein FimT
MKRQKGFTLIELLTTLSVATILVGVAVPGLQEFQKNSRQRSATNELVAAMRIARNTAITTNSRVTVCASSNEISCQNVSWDNGWIAFVDTNSDRVLNGTETVLRSGSGIRGVTIASGQFASFFVYRPNGRAMNASISGNSGQFTICDDRGNEHAKTIQLDLSGRARAVSAYGSGGGDGTIQIAAACPTAVF